MKHFSKNDDILPQLIFNLFAEPQEQDPVITFNKDTYEIGEILEANCTSSPSRPPPHITWFINDQKVRF